MRFHEAIQQSHACSQFWFLWSSEFPFLTPVPFVSFTTGLVRCSGLTHTFPPQNVDVINCFLLYSGLTKLGHLNATRNKLLIVIWRSFFVDVSFSYLTIGFMQGYFFSLFFFWLSALFYFRLFRRLDRSFLKKKTRPKGRVAEWGLKKNSGWADFACRTW